MLIKVKVFPNSKEELVIKKKEDEYEIKVKDKPEHGKANDKVKQLLANFFGKDQEKIVLIKGRHQQNKIFKVY